MPSREGDVLLNVNLTESGEGQKTGSTGSPHPSRTSEGEFTRAVQDLTKAVHSRSSGIPGRPVIGPPGFFDEPTTFPRQDPRASSQESVEHRHSPGERTPKPVLSPPSSPPPPRASSEASPDDFDPRAIGHPTDSDYIPPKQPKADLPQGSFPVIPLPPGSLDIEPEPPSQAIPPKRGPGIVPEGEVELKPTVTEQIGKTISEFAGSRAGASFIGSGVTSVTGSTTAGGLAGAGVSSLMAGGGALASAAGPIGLAIVAAKLVGEIRDAIAETIDTVVKGTADTITSPTPADPQKSFLGRVSAASEYADPIQKFFGINTTVIDDVFRTLVDTTTLLIGNFDSLADELQGFSGPVAAAKGEAEIRRIETQIRRGDVIGEDLAKFAETRSEGSAAIEELKTNLMSGLLPMITNISERITEIARLLVATQRVAARLIGQGNVEQAQGLVNRIVNWPFDKFQKAFDFILGDFAELVREELKKMDDADLDLNKEIEQFLNFAAFANQAGIPQPVPRMGAPGGL